MSLILINRIKNHIDNSLKDLMYLDDCLNEEVKMYSRGLVGICLSSLSGRQYQDIVNHITDGAQDNGIDGAYYDEIRNKLYLVQSKWSSKGSSTIGSGDLHKFIAGVCDLLNENWKKFNARMKLISLGISEGIKRDPEIVIVAAFNSDNPVSIECQEIIDSFVNANNTEDQEVVSFKVFNLKNIVRTMKSSRSSEKSDVEINLLHWGEQKEPYFAIYGKISCADIAEWHKTYGDILFSENIRSALLESEINAQIESTLINSPIDFWYLNNGITAIADSLSRKPIGLGDQKESSYWNVGNIKIVNGAQTTSSIARSYEKNPTAVKKGYVQVKIVSLEKAPIDIASRITTATNTQNKVEPKDFLALEALQDGLAESFKKLGIQYCFRRGEKVTNPDNGLDVIELAMAMAVSGENVNNVVVAKRNAGSLTDPNGHYGKLFDGNLVAKDLWNIVVRWRQVTKLVDSFAKTVSGKDSQLAVHGNRFIEHLLLRNSDEFLNAVEVGNIHTKLKSLVEKMYPESYLAVLFKNSKKCEILKGHFEE